MVKIFKNVRAQRNESLLNILGFLATAKNPITPYTIKKMLGKDKAYSGAHKNIAFLEEKGFVKTETQERGRKKRLCDITIKGALASLFASSHTLDHSKLLKRWRERDWGSSYKQPFKNIKDASELKNFVEILCSYVGSLEEVNEEILKRGLRNPEDIFNLIANATITVEKKISENGKYEVTIPYIPGTVVSVLLKKRKNIHVIVAPEEETGKILFDFLSQDPNYKKKFEICLQLILQTIAGDLMAKSGGGVFSHYFPDLRTFVLTATLPEKVASLLSYPEQVLEFTENSYHGIVKPFLESDEFVKGSKAWFIFRALKYDPKKRDLSPLSKDDVREKARALLE